MFSKISRLVLTILAALILSSVSAPLAVQAKPLALTSMAWNYSGSYSLGGRRGTVSFAVSRGIRPGMWEGTAVINGKSMYSNGITQTDGTMVVNFFTLDANFNQVPVATMCGTFSPDYLIFKGSFVMQGRTGTASLKAK